MHYKFCPKCGSELAGKTMGDEGEVPFCKSCNEPFFDTFSTCVITLVVDEYNEAALLEQSYISKKYRNLVSGYMKPGETAELAAKREVKEEIGADLYSLTPVETYWFGKKDMLMIGFIGRAKKCDMVLSKEVDGADWIEIGKAVKMVHPKGSVSNSLIEAYIERYM